MGCRKQAHKRPLAPGIRAGGPWAHALRLAGHDRCARCVLRQVGRTSVPSCAARGCQKAGGAPPGIIAPTRRTRLPARSPPTRCCRAPTAGQSGLHSAGGVASDLTRGAARGWPPAPPRAPSSLPRPRARRAVGRRPAGALRPCFKYRDQGAAACPRSTRSSTSSAP